MQRGSYTEDAMVTGDIPKRMMQRWSYAEEMTVQGDPVRRVRLDVELL